MNFIKKSANVTYKAFLLSIVATALFLLCNAITAKAATYETEISFEQTSFQTAQPAWNNTYYAYRNYTSSSTDLSGLVALKFDISDVINRDYYTGVGGCSYSITNKSGETVASGSGYGNWIAVDTSKTQDLQNANINFTISFWYPSSGQFLNECPVLTKLNVRIDNPAIGEPHPSWQAQTIVERANNTWWTGAMTNGTFYSKAIDLTHVKNLSFQLQCGGGTSSAEPTITIVDDDDNILKTVTEGNTQTLKPNVYTPYKVNVSSLTGIGYVKLSGSNFKVQASEITSELMQYTLTYNANGGSNAPTSATVTAGNIITISSTKPSRANYDFLGWASSENSTVAEFVGGDTLEITENTTLYAVWKSQSPYFSGFGNLPSVI